MGWARLWWPIFGLGLALGQASALSFGRCGKKAHTSLFFYFFS
jgi:hypothetical protein